tara:strand:- start:587 stop:727 length:141 start_codon:yes stop_codon:yes gene_type:complete
MVKYFEFETEEEYYKFIKANLNRVSVYYKNTKPPYYVVVVKEVKNV